MFWECFFKLCENNQTTPNAIAKIIGISNATTTKWKKGSIPNGETLIKIADYFDCSVDYLLGRTDIQKLICSQDFYKHTLSVNKAKATGFSKLPEIIIRPMVGIAAAGKPLSMTVGSYDMIKIDAVSDIHKKISPQDFVVEIHGDSMIDVDIFDGDYAVIRPCPMAENGEIALVAVGDDCTLKKFYRTDSGIELHPCNAAYDVQKYKLSDKTRIIGLFVCTCTGDIIIEN